MIRHNRNLLIFYNSIIPQEPLVFNQFCKRNAQCKDIQMSGDGMTQMNSIITVSRV
nr:MAG TPA: hypothetical protein [Siphoviridae sp. ctnpB30]